MMSAVPLKRPAVIQRLATDQFDLIIIGGGITGAGIALDAVTRGLKVALVERGWPHTLLITITERIPVAVAATAGGFNLIDDEGNVEVIVPGDYPIINLFGALELAKYAIGD